jgi:PAS domain S-box-containing protein
MTRMMKRLLTGTERAGAFGCRCFWWPNVLQLVLFTLLALLPLTKVQATQKNVLILSGGRGRVSINQMETSLRAHFSEPVNFSIVDLENPRFDQKSYQQNLAEALEGAYSTEKLDLVIAVGTNPLQFAVQYRETVFPGVPIVFMSVINPLPEKMWPGVTGVISATGAHETIELALRLHPDTQMVALISYASGPDYDWFQAQHFELLRHKDKLREIDFLGPVSPELLQKVAELPPHTVILFQIYPQDSNQPAFGALDVLAAVAQRFPTYSILPNVTVGHGAIGGASYDPPTDAALAGELAARVLSGERPEDIPVVQNSRANVSVDWRELRRWNIPESALPPGTLVLFRESTLWERGRKYFIAGIAVILGQGFLILALFWQRSRKRRAEAELRRSEEKFSKSFRHSPLLIAITRMSDSRYLDVNETFEQHLGWSRNEVIGRTPHDFNLWVDADKRTAFAKELQTKGSVRDLEVCLRKKDGETRILLLSAESIEVGSELCALSVAADITERKQAEEVLSSMSRRLIEAQEKERSWIARELHDDINQRVAMVSTTLESLKLDFPSSEMLARCRLEETQQQVDDLGNDVQALSHRLHSSKLDYLGLEVACRGFCHELSERQSVEIEFDSDNVPKNLSKEISLCLFRVLQEALQNAVKYSGARQFRVSLKGKSTEIELRVQDSGVGFDLEKAIGGHGLGLTSMRERMKLVDGLLSIDSRPERGTTIRACVPLVPKTVRAVASG